MALNVLADGRIISPTYRVKRGWKWREVVVLFQWSDLLHTQPLTIFWRRRIWNFLQGSFHYIDILLFDGHQQLQDFVRRGPPHTLPAIDLNSRASISWWDLNKEGIYLMNRLVDEGPIDELLWRGEKRESKEKREQEERSQHSLVLLEQATKSW